MPEVTATAFAAGEVVVAIDGDAGLLATPPAEVEEDLRLRFPRRDAAVFFARARGGGFTLVSARDAASVPAGPGELLPRSLLRGGIPARESALRAVLEEAARRDASAVALVAAAPRKGSPGWLGTLVEPVVDGGFDFVRPAYVRPPADGLLNTGVVYPLVRALYGKRLRQPLGGEACLSGAFARRLLDDPDWRRDPENAGSDAWLVAKALAGRNRVSQAWLGPMPQEDGGNEDASHAIVRALGPVFRELERHAVRWQRIDTSQPIAAFGPGDSSPPGEAPPHASGDRLVEAFRNAAGELATLWGLVLPPATLLALRRVARLPTETFRIDDALWARVVFDFAVAYHVKTMERTQLLSSFTPLYLGWVGGFLHELSAAEGVAASEARVEQLALAFEREKAYLIGRWRWPDGFNP